MKNLDYKYICTVIGNLLGVPVRLFIKSQLRFYYSLTNLPRDPISPYIDDILKIDAHVGHYVTPDFHYYGIVSDGTNKIVIGPTIQTAGSEQTIKELALQCDVPTEETQTFIKGMRDIAHLSLDSVMQMLCIINYIVNNEKFGLGDIIIYDSEQKNLKEQLQNERIDHNLNYEFDQNYVHTHSALIYEQTIMDFVRKGNTEGLKEWAANAPVIRAGIIATDQLRQMKNMFIVSITLVTRAAIQGGMDTDDAMTLSDAYIQKCELLYSVERILNLQYRMILDYTERVAKLKISRFSSSFITDVVNFVQHHISETISTDDIAKFMFISRSRLSTRFKAETGINLSDYILKEKTEEAKRLLLYTDKPLSAISAHLGFSSQSHFSHVFKRFSGVTPGHYRENKNEYIKSVE